MKKNRIAIVATSPLQIMLAHKICDMYNPAYVKCFIMTYKGDNRYQKCENLANEYGYEVQAIQITSYRVTVIKNTLSSLFVNKGFDLVIQGMFYGLYYYAFSVKLLRKGGDLIMTDDGVATLGLEDDQVMIPLMSSPILKGIFSIMKFRKIKHRLFYTIFNSVKSKYFDIKGLSLSINDKSKGPNGIYLVGTFQESYFPTFNPSMTDKQFNNLLSQTVNFLRTNYPDEDILYTPHGLESKADSLQICKQMNLHYLPSEVSVEIDYPKNGHYPKVIVGFMSTALFTLKAMYPLAKVIDIQPANIEYKYQKKLEKLCLSEDSLGITRMFLHI